MKTGSPDRTPPGGVRPPAVAGMFYPGEPVALRAAIAGMLPPRPAQRGETVRGIIAPHAGYAYSGPTAAMAYGLLRPGEYASVVIVSPSHREYFEGVSVYDGGAYATPLGTIPVDGPLRDALTAGAHFVCASSAGHHGEHAVEVHLPFLQTVLGEFSLLPLVIGHQQPEVCFALGEALARIIGRGNVLLVASTDLSHFHPDAEAKRFDAVTIADVRAMDPEALMAHIAEGATEACGGGPAVAVLSALKRLGAGRVDLVHYATSGDVTGDRRSVVGYMSAAAY